jgi:hypothetical protein
MKRGHAGSEKAGEVSLDLKGQPLKHPGLLDRLALNHQHFFFMIHHRRPAIRC